MGNTSLQRSIVDRQRAVRRAIGRELQRARLEAGLSLRRVGREAAVDASHIRRAELGEAALSQDALVAVSAVIGHDVSLRLYPSSGPRVRDHVQVRMLESLLRTLHPRWQAHLEVAVYRPVHGVIDVVLVDAEAGEVVSGESHSQLHAIDAQVRWATQKTDALPSARGWPWIGESEPRRTRLLLLRDNGANRTLVREATALFAAAYPASSAAAFRSLSDRAPWPGSAIVWVHLDGVATRLLQGDPAKTLDSTT
jgi:transcriptional regulator with XRE-family HTH domain